MCVILIDEWDEAHWSTHELIRELRQRALFDLGARPVSRLLALSLRKAVAGENGVSTTADGGQKLGLGWFGHDITDRVRHGRFDVALEGNGFVLIWIAGHDPAVDELETMAAGASLVGVTDLLLEEVDFPNLVVVRPTSFAGGSTVVTPGGYRWRVATYEDLSHDLRDASFRYGDDSMAVMLNDAADIARIVGEVHRGLADPSPHGPLALPSELRRDLRRAGIEADIALGRLTRAAAMITEQVPESSRHPVLLRRAGASTGIRQVVQLDTGDALGWESNGSRIRRLVVTGSLHGPSLAAKRRREEYVIDRYAEFVGTLHGLGGTPIKLRHQGSDTVYSQWSGAFSIDDLALMAHTLPHEVLRFGSVL